MRRFRVGLPSDEHVMGMSTASCIVIKGKGKDGSVAVRPYTPTTTNDTKVCVCVCVCVFVCVVCWVSCPYGSRRSIGLSGAFWRFVRTDVRAPEVKGVAGMRTQMVT